MAGPRLTEFGIKGYRSIGDWVHVTMPDGDPLVLIGENNAGKSNILRALNLILGDYWPGTHRPEDHEYFGRAPEGNEIKIRVGTSGIPCPKGCTNSEVTKISWTYAPDDEPPSSYKLESSACPHTWVTNEVRHELICMSVGVNRDLSYQLSYGSKWTTLSKLMRRFHERLVAEPNRVEKLEEIFGSLVNTFEEVEEYQTFAGALRSSFADFGGNLAYGLGVDFSAYDPSNYFRSLRVFPHLDGIPRTYEELGTGQEQILAMAFSYAYAHAFGGEGLLLAIEEPESHLHPLAQQWLARKLRDLAAFGVQVVVTTHSPYFVNLAKPGTTALVRKQAESDGTTVKQFTATELAAELVKRGAPPDAATADTIGAFYAAAATYATTSGLFARVCVLVEGQTEELALPILLRRVGLDLLARGVAIVPVNGLTNMAKWARMYGAYGIPVYPVFDSDANLGPDEAESSRTAAEEVLEALQAEQTLSPASNQLTVGAFHACFDPNYEAVMRATFASYEALESQASATIGRSKPLKARECARRLEDPEAGSGEWHDLIGLAEAIGALAPEPPTGGVTYPTPPPLTGGVSRRASRTDPSRGRSP